MDLFSDLPEPERENAEQEQQSSRMLSTLDVKSDSKSTHTHKAEPNQGGLLYPYEGGASTWVGDEKQAGPCASAKRKSVDVNAHDAPSKRLATGMYQLKGYYAERKGERKEMQDAHVILDDFTSQFINLPSTVSRMAFYAVYDGHSGDRASKHAASTLHKHLLTKFPKAEASNRDKEIKKCLIDTFKVTDDEFLKQASSIKPVWKDGSTAVCVLAVDNTLYIANLGDSKAFLCRYNPESKQHQFLPLSKDHSPTQYEERMRIQKAGGYVKDGRVMGIMEVSRSIGDGRFKHCGVTCTPDIKKCQLGENDRYLLLSCDGLWQGFNSDTASQFINKILQEEEVKQAEGKTRDDVVFETACNRLASESIRRGSSDNVTVILVNISKGPG